ncbi:MAG TPA: SprT family zinc-dependent metalloprotease [Candidatus Saccharimonadales bacterium]|nr:SprT family zinc-dependent metalloprotease [Candidatus Saccharimonadales bacterium]
MPVKTVDIPGIGLVSLQKKRQSRSLRINISNNGQVRLTMPTWTPYRLGINFLHSKIDWIKENQPPKRFLRDKMRIGKAHQLVFVEKPSGRASTRINGSDVKVILPRQLTTISVAAQSLAHKAVEKALKQEAEQLLPNRLQQVAKRHGFNYRSVQIKRLSSRWGSCDQSGNITLNCYLMQLPWRLIDYVLLHELTHTKIMAHGSRFWKELDKYIPNLPEIRKEIRGHRPSLYF